MSFKSATQIGKKVGISYQKVNHVLAENNLYDKVSRRPTLYALENKLAEMRTATSRFIGKGVEFIVWDYGKLEQIFSLSLKQDIATCCRSPADALNKICDAFSDLGYMLDIEPGTPPTGISENTHYAVVQAYFSDPDFLRGQLLLFRFFHPDEAETAKNLTLSLAYELFNVAVKIDAKRAQSNLQAIERVMSWLCKKAR